MRWLLIVSLAAFANAAIAEPVELTAVDGVKVFGEVWRAAGAHRPIILAFHQAESNRAEYAPLAARLNAAGFTVLAIDQRSGGNYFGGTNQTVALHGDSLGYDAALPDLAAALEWARSTERNAPILVWGSSYSAALVFVLAAQNPGAIAGVLAFSPAEYLDQPDAVRKAAAKVDVPVYITQAKDRSEIAAAREIFSRVASSEKTQFIPAIGGVHGSATLRKDKNAAGAEENWQAVLRFLGRFAKPQKAAR
ncbi:MAG: alpha/beta fold hydrolase [Casimicrobiaceae bacterium]